VYSLHVRYLQTSGSFPDEILEDYARLFPDRPLLPHVRSVHAEHGDATWLRFLIRSSTPSENQPTASASTLRCLYIYRSPLPDLLEESKGLARDLVAFQRSNSKLGGGLETFQDSLSFPFSPPYFAFQARIENAFALPPPEAADSPVHGLRRLKVTHSLRELPAFFGRVAKMRALEHLKIVIAKVDCDMPDAVEAENEKEGVQHSLSSLEIEGRWSDLLPAINLCKLPSAAAQSQTLRLYYYLLDRPRTQEAVAQLLDLPARIIHPDHLETLTIELLDIRNKLQKEVLALTVDAFRPLLRYRQMVTLHLDLPCHFLLDIEFLHALAAVMGGTLRHLVVLRAVTLWTKVTSPVLTVDDLATIAGIILPRLETLGLDVVWDKPHSSVASSVLRTLYVGAGDLYGRDLGELALFLKTCFPGLQYLCYHLIKGCNTGWTSVMDDNRYSGGYYGPGGQDWWPTGDDI